MSLLETAVSDLAEALDKLEAKLDARLDGQLADRDALAAARRCASAARVHATEAGAGLGAAISDLKALLTASEARADAQAGAGAPRRDDGETKD